MLKSSLRAVALVALLGACAPAEPEPLPTPWEGVDLSAGVLQGAFHTRIGDTHPGLGWFSGELSGHVGSRADLHDVTGATWSVLRIHLLGWQAEGWSTLELDIAKPAWLVGELRIDGESAVGVWTGPDGTRRYLVDGVLEVTDAGLAEGEVVAGHFHDLPLTEAR